MLAMSTCEPEALAIAIRVTQRALRRLRRAWTLTCVGMLVTVASLLIARQGGGITILFGLGAIGVGLYRMFVSLRDLEVADAIEFAQNSSRKDDVPDAESTDAQRQL
jgi:hypothetical protein